MIAGTVARCCSGSPTHPELEVAVIAGVASARTAECASRVAAAAHGRRASRRATYAWYGLAVMQTALEHASYAELVERGDRDAEAEVCRRFAPRIRLYGLKHLRDEDRAAELVQRVLVAVIEALRAARVEEPHHFERFVLGTCRNLAARMRAADRRNEPIEDHALEQLGAVMPATEAIDVGALTHCIHKLDARARSVLFMSFYRDKSADEIASVLDTTAGNVRVVRHRAMTQLRHCMEGAA